MLGLHNFNLVEKIIMDAINKGRFTANTLIKDIEIKLEDISDVFANKTYTKTITLLNKLNKLIKADFCIAYKMEVISFNKNCNIIPKKTMKTERLSVSLETIVLDMLKKTFQFINLNNIVDTHIDIKGNLKIKPCSGNPYHK